MHSILLKRKLFEEYDVYWKNDQTLGELMKDLLTRALDARGGLSRWRDPDDDRRVRGQELSRIYPT